MFEYVPSGLHKPKSFATFDKELLNAVTCCEAVEQNPWNTQTARDVLNKARLRKVRPASVRAVSLPSEPSCTQPFMAFKAQEPDGHITYIVAFRSDLERYDTMVSTPVSFTEVNDKFKVHNSLRSRAVNMPLHPLPVEWRSGLQDRSHRLLLTGFSVGGAVAALATLQLLDKEPDLKDQIRCYTFGAPLQGDQSYADCINGAYASNFYHVMISGDQIPAVLTLVSKVAENKPNTCSDVAKNICIQVLATAAQMATGIALNAVAPGLGEPVAQAVDFNKLGTKIKSLVKSARQSKMSLPEYIFGGSLVYLETKQNRECSMYFVDDRVSKGPYFKVSESSSSSSSSQPIALEFKLHQVKEFSRAIQDLDISRYTDDIKVAPVEPKFGRIQGLHRSHGHVSEVVKDVGDGRGGIAECSAERDVVTPGPTAAREITQPKDVEALLVPKFDENPIEVWLDKHENITIQVCGDNMVLGLHVLYMIKDEEKLRIPVWTDYNPPSEIKPEDDPHQSSTEESFSNLPLQFITQGIKGLSFKEPDGIFKVQLAFGHHIVPASEANLSLFDSLDVLKVAERFSTQRPEELIDLLLFWGMARAQAQCTAAFYEIKKNPNDVDNIVCDTLAALLEVPPEFALLDKLLLLIDITDQWSARVEFEKLPSQMSDALRASLGNGHEGDVLRAGLEYGHAVVPDGIRPGIATSRELSKRGISFPFLQNNALCNWTFTKCYTRVIESQSIAFEKMLKEKELAEGLSKLLDAGFAGPKRMLDNYVNRRFEFKEYAKEYAMDHIDDWETEVQTVAKAGVLLGVGASAVPVGILYINEILKSDWLGIFALMIGIPPATVGAGLFGSLWCLYHVFSSPVRSFLNRPGLMAEFLCKGGIVADNWEKKLQAAALLFKSKIEPPYQLACKQEFDLNNFLKGNKRSIFLEDDLFDFSNFKGISEKARHGVTVCIQLANYGLAGAFMYNIRRHLTDRNTALGLIGSTRAGKSAFASQAFGVSSNPGAAMASRTRVLRHWTLELGAKSNRQFTLIDFPGSTDRAAQDWYIRGQLLASVLVVLLNIKEMNTAHCLTLVKKVCKAKHTDEEICILFCFTHADQEYGNYEDEAEGAGSDTTAAQLFVKNFDTYKAELQDGAREADSEGVHREQLEYIMSNMHACCFKPRLQDESDDPLALKLKEVGVKNVKWVKDWCMEKLVKLNESRMKRQKSIAPTERTSTHA